MMVNADTISGLAGEALVKYRLLRLSGSREFSYCRPGDSPIGVNGEDVALAGDVNCHLLVGRLGSIELEVDGAIALGGLVYPGHEGKGSANAIGRPIGLALMVATAAADVIEVLPMPDGSGRPGLDEVVLFDDFMDLLLTGAERRWSGIQTDTGTITLLDAAAGVLQLEASDGTIGDNDESYVHTTNELFLFAANKPIYLEARLKLGAADTDNANVMVGLLSAPAANAILDNGAGPPASYSGVVVYKVDGGAAWAAEASIAGTQTPIVLTAPGAPGATYQRIGILVVPTSSTSATVYIFIDGVLVGTQAFTYTSATEMAAFAGVKNGATTVNTTLHLDYLLCRQAR